jgi:hypothetical protein
MNSKRFPYVLLLIGTLGFALYPRFLPTAAPAYLRTDFAVGLVYGACIGLELLGVLFAARKQPRCA